MAQTQCLEKYSADSVIHWILLGSISLSILWLIYNISVSFWYVYKNRIYDSGHYKHSIIASVMSLLSCAAGIAGITLVGLLVDLTSDPTSLVYLPSGSKHQDRYILSMDIVVFLQSLLTLIILFFETFVFRLRKQIYWLSGWLHTNTAELNIQCT